MSQKKFYRKEDLVNKVVVNQEGNNVGSVKDTAFDAEGKLALIVERKGSPEGEEEYISINDIKGFGDFILLKETQNPAVTTVPPQPSDKRICLKCGYGNSQSQSYCTKCGAKLQ